MAEDDGTECANPLLLGWIKEWYDKAKEQSSKGVFTYKKAYTSMKACPIKFVHPSQAQELQGLGPKLCDRLTECLQAHCRENGLPMPEDPRKAKKRRSAGGEEGEGEAPAKKARVTEKKLYVPKLRSGAYAILLALSTLSEDASTGMTKTQTIELAQPHCESSFTAPSDPTKTYTAWSSVKTLIEKDLIYVSGGVSKRYMLTEEGWEVSKKIKEAGGLDNRQLEHSCDGLRLNEAAAKPGKSSRSHKMSLSQPLPEPKGQQRAVPASTRGAFVDLDNLSAEEWGPFDDYEEPFPPLPPNSRQKDRFRNPTTSLPPLTAASRVSKKKTKLTRSYTDTDFLEILSSSPPRPSSKSATFREPLRPPLPQTLNRQKPSREASQEPLGTEKDAFRRQKQPDNVEQLSSLPYPYVATQQGKAPQNKPPLPPPQLEQQSSTIEAPPGSFTIELIIDTREVRSKTDRDYIGSTLITHGIRATTRALDVGDALWVARVHCPTVLSTLASANNPSNPSTTTTIPNSSEFILDYILERKRLDDLIGSIKDGRFTEQKFRLKKSGIANVIYLIEDVTLGAGVADAWHEGLLSAIASTQVVNGFFVKRTRKLDDSIRYLANMTKLLKRRYEGKTLRVAVGDPEDVAAARLLAAEGRKRRTDGAIATTTATTITSATCKDTQPYISYPAFSALSAKSSTLTLRDLFLKMLLCVRGLTAEKALAVQAVWPTPRALVEAYKACGGIGSGGSGGALEGDKDREKAKEKAKREMLWKELGGLVGRRAVGKAVSARAAEVWGAVGGNDDDEG